MKSSHLALGLFVLLSPCARSFADEDKGTPRPCPSPRHSGEGQIAFASNNVQLLSWLPLAELSPGAATGNDCWGYTSPSDREYAIIGVNTGTAFVEVTDPGAAVLLSFHGGPNSLWRDMKVYGDNAYVVSEGGGGIQVFDMSAIDSGTVTLVNTVTTGGCTTSTHNVALDTTSGYLYRCGGSGSPCGGGPQGLVIYDVVTNPDVPTVVGSWNNRYVHDCQVVVSTRPGALNGRQLAFCAADDNADGGMANLQILDVTDKASIIIVASADYPFNLYSHQVWLTPDQRYAYLNDERDESTFGFDARTRIFDVSDPTAPVHIGFFSSGVPAADHNLYVTGDKIFEANYRSGLRVFDNTSPTTPTVYGFFDTFEGSNEPEYEGLWSNYPFFSSGTVLGSDREKGLFVWRLGAAKLTFDFPSGVPEFIAPAGETVQFLVLENQAGDLQGGTVEFRYSTGGSFTTVGATPLGGGLYTADLPATPCGTEFQFYVSARSADEVTWTDPPAGLTQVHFATSATGGAVAHEETLEIDTGWVVDGVGDTATTGIWTRVNPIGSAAQPEDDHTVNPGTMAWVTGQGTLGGSPGENDVDGGVTTLRTPILDASGLSNPYVVYWRWYSNHLGVVDDTFLIDISDDGGASWVALEVLGPTGPDCSGGWIKHHARIADFVVPTSNLQLRFRAQDTGTGSIVEAAIDDLRILDLDCVPVIGLTSIMPDTGALHGGERVTITGAGFVPGGTTVSFGAIAAPLVNVLSYTQLEVEVPRATWTRTGRLGRADSEVAVSVTTIAGTATLPAAFTYLPQLR